MNKQIVFTGTGHKHQILEMEISNLLPNEYASSIGHFVFLDFNPARNYQPKTPHVPDGSFAHPHRGIATFTYITHGEFEHFDSRGHHAVVGKGGAQWMKAGSGIVHDENFSQGFQKRGGLGGGLQFWVNLPAAVKKETPEYTPLQAEDFQTTALPDDAGFLKILMGVYEDKSSKVKTYAEQFMYHLQINPGKSFALPISREHESAAITLDGVLQVSGVSFGKGNVLVFGDEGETVELANITKQPADIIVFGGEPYTENIVARGPFVMNSQQEIIEAFDDYRAGKYRSINYSQNA